MSKYCISIVKGRLAPWHNFINTIFDTYAEAQDFLDKHDDWYCFRDKGIEEIKEDGTYRFTK